MPRLLADSEIDIGDEELEGVMTAAEEAAATARLTRVPENVPDLSDGGMVGAARLYPMENGKKMSQGRANARRAWMWDGTETVLPLGWNPEGTRHDGARPYMSKRHCLCCNASGFRGSCLRCVRSNCRGCASGTDKTKLIACFYLSKEKVPFPQKFYGVVPCFLPMCNRREAMGFKTEEDMRMHARTKHRLEYASFLEVQQSRRSDEADSLRQRVDQLTAMLLQPKREEPAPSFLATCQGCGQTFENRTQGMAQNGLRLHQRRCKDLPSNSQTKE